MCFGISSCRCIFYLVYTGDVFDYMSYLLEKLNFWDSLWDGGPKALVFDKLGMTQKEIWTFLTNRTFSDLIITDSKCVNWWSELGQIHQKVSKFKNIFSPNVYIKHKILVWDNVLIEIEKQNYSIQTYSITFSLISCLIKVWIGTDVKLSNYFVFMIQISWCFLYQFFFCSDFALNMDSVSGLKGHYFVKKRKLNTEFLNVQYQWGHNTISIIFINL